MLTSGLHKQMHTHSHTFTQTHTHTHIHIRPLTHKHTGETGSRMAGAIYQGVADRRTAQWTQFYFHRMR